jgi:antitoxin component of MazEF toxin-antitoxin module
MTETIQVTSQGVLVPRPLLQAWGDIQEVEVEQRPDAIVIKPKARSLTRSREQMLQGMKAAGLVEELRGTPPPRVSAEERARLAKILSHGKPLSEIIIEDREDRA